MTRIHATREPVPGSRGISSRPLVQRRGAHPSGACCPGQIGTGHLPPGAANSRQLLADELARTLQQPSVAQDAEVTAQGVTARTAAGVASPWPAWIRRCGIGSSCSCEPHDKVTGIRRDPQRATIAQTEQEPTAASSTTVQPATGPTWAKPVDRVLRSPGQPLDATARQEMEQRFGHDFGEVRVHTGDVAAESARAVQALAYTVGYDVVLGADQGRLGTARRRVLMHELAHVVQYAQGAEVPGTGLTLGDVHDPAERAADAAVDAAERMHVTTADRGTDNGMRGRMGGGTGRLRRQPAPGPAPGPGPGVTPGQISACRIEFQKGSTATVDATARDACLELARAYVAAGGARTVAVHGYASEEGDAAFNTDLAQRRAQRVRQLLVGVGIPDTAILVSGHGADRTYPELAPNRRAEVVLSESISFPGENVTVAKFTCGPGSGVVLGAVVRLLRGLLHE